MFRTEAAVYWHVPQAVIAEFDLNLVMAVKLSNDAGERSFDKAQSRSLPGQRLLHDLRRNNLGADRLGAWVPNEPDDIAFWLSQPIRRITTDRPDIALGERRKLN